jgi:hypothetical protein
MTRTIDGLTFHIHSPSLLELLNVKRDVEADARVFVSFVGVWTILYEDLATGHTVTRAFKSRDEAIKLLSDRRAA